MMPPKFLRIQLKSAATFGRGDGVAGYIDREIEHDRYGFPFLRGRTLKGLLAESAENVVFALEKQGKTGWRPVKESLFGRPGRGGEEQGLLQVGDATLPESLKQLVLSEKSLYYTRENVLETLTGIRRQTAINPDGGSNTGSLRAMRVVLKGVVLHATLTFAPAFERLEEGQRNERLAVLAATVLDFRRAGTGRNRGRGSLKADLENEELTKAYFKNFIGKVKTT
jgi:hypothetical protein